MTHCLTQQGKTLPSRLSGDRLSRGFFPGRKLSQVGLLDGLTRRFSGKILRMAHGKAPVVPTWGRRYLWSRKCCQQPCRRKKNSASEDSLTLGTLRTEGISLHRKFSSTEAEGAAYQM
ncbi:hypothetical protein HispidOSU_018260 [Sigmodon hispidus]